MIDYSLARQLKDAGFPQTGNGNTQVLLATDNIHAAEDSVYVPTLSELIEALDKDYFNLVHSIEIKGFPQVGKYYVISEISRDGGPVFASDDPVAALSKLWLALNKK